MEHAKKLVLMEPRLLEQMQSDREYKEINKPAEKKTKTALSLEMRKILEDDSVGDDIKAKRYQQVLNKYLTVKDKIPHTVEGNVNWLTEPPRQPVVLSPAPARATRKRTKQASYQTVLRPRVTKKTVTSKKSVSPADWRSGAVSPIVSTPWEFY